MTAEDTPKTEAPSRRLRVTRASGAPLATITFTAAEDGHVDIRIQGQADAHDLVQCVDALKALRATLPADNDPACRMDQAAEQFQEIAIGHGYVVTALPPGDIELQGVFDLNTGRAFSTQTALHPLAVNPPDISQALAKILQDMPANFSRGIVQTIESHLEAGDHGAAAKALDHARDEGQLSFADRSVLNIAYRIDPQALPGEAERNLRLLRSALAAKLARVEFAAADIEALLARNDSDPETHANLQLSYGIVLQKRGTVQAAISLWRKVARDGTLSAGIRAWAWRNLSLALPATEKEAIHAARASADAFLEDGKKRDAVASLLGLFDILEHHDPRLAATELESVLELVDGPDLLGRVERAALHHALGNRYIGMRDPARALTEAEAAIALRRGLGGAEEELISSLHLAALAAKALGRTERANDFEVEAKALTMAVGSQRFELAGRISAMLANYDQAAVVDLIADARASGDVDLWSTAELACVLGDPNVGPTTRLAKLEQLHAELAQAGGRFESRKPFALAIAIELADQGDLPASATWLQNMLAEDPGALDVRDRLAATLQEAEQWGDLAVLMKRELSLRGEMTGLLVTYGQALLESGDASAAVTKLTAALQKMMPDSPARAFATELRERALNSGGTILPPASIAPDSAVLRTDFERALHDYRRFISGEKRMSFWRGGTPDHSWVDQPERHAQDLLHTFLKARFDDRIEVFEELGAGAGRMDLLVRLRGGLQAIIELKLCGYGYSSNYAASGEDQIRHYMAARAVHLGYLVVHDARLTDNGKVLLAQIAGPDTVFEVLIDVVPRMPEKRGKRRGALGATKGE